MLFYAGIGSRQTPLDILHQMDHIAYELAGRGYTLRSGGADGADKAFERGSCGKCEIYLPWRGFNGNHSKLFTPTPAAMKLASQIHPAWGRCSEGARKLHARNCHQILGLDLQTPVEFVVCWHNGTGGTLQAVRLAELHSIRVINLRNEHFTL